MEFLFVQPGDRERIATIRDLFLEYQGELGIDLCFQGFQEELATLPGKYGPPSGCLLLVFDGENPVACGALRDIGDGICELKRIYVRPVARRRGLARSISERLIAYGREAGFRTARLDTLRRLAGAVELYQQLGFRFIEPYNYNPEEDIVYMELPLSAL
ncbi:MAG TPA: GNAT family N-acetyltransferase [Fimbriimonadaceae bacterium]|nr:GNAT family N-acetyltransferase [Fimbriimonadaceae bacterium]